MKRAERVMEKAAEIVSESRKPSAAKLSEELQMPEQDVHRCLNHLEKKRKVDTYTKEVFGTKHRMVGVKR